MSCVCCCCVCVVCVCVCVCVCVSMHTAKPQVQLGTSTGRTKPQYGLQPLARWVIFLARCWRSGVSSLRRRAWLQLVDPSWLPGSPIWRPHKASFWFFVGPNLADWIPHVASTHGAKQSAWTFLALGRHSDPASSMLVLAL